MHGLVTEVVRLSQMSENGDLDWASHMRPNKETLGDGDRKL